MGTGRLQHVLIAFENRIHLVLCALRADLRLINAVSRM